MRPYKNQSYGVVKRRCMGSKGTWLFWCCNVNKKVTGVDNKLVKEVICLVSDMKI